MDVEAALALLVEEPGIGTKVETPRSEVVRRLYLPRVGYFVYYRVRGTFLEARCLYESPGTGELLCKHRTVGVLGRGACPGSVEESPSATAL